jgi:hypothetical protein
MKTEILNFRLDMFSISDQVLLVGHSIEGEAKRILGSPEVNDLFQRAATFNEQLKRSLDEKKFRKEIYEFGEYLFELVFSHDMGRLFASTQGALGDNDALQVLIRIGSPELASVLWEVMREENNFISQKYRFIRYPMIRKRRPEKIAVKKPAKMLVVAADPLKSLDINRELDALDRALANLEDRVQVTKLVEPNATFENIDRELKKCPDVFHFIGHGAYDDNDPESSYLVIDSDESESGSFEGGRLPLSSISATLALSPANMIFLNACQTAGSTSTAINENFVNMAYELIRLGNRCIVAMSHAISDMAAISLSTGIYKGIFKDLEPIDLVLTRCKNDLYTRIAQGKSLPIDWCSPILYTRAEELGILEAN